MQMKKTKNVKEIKNTFLYKNDNSWVVPYFIILHKTHAYVETNKRKK